MLLDILLGSERVSVQVSHIHADGELVIAGVEGVLRAQIVEGSTVDVEGGEILAEHRLDGVVVDDSAGPYVAVEYGRGTLNDFHVVNVPGVQILAPKHSIPKCVGSLNAANERLGLVGRLRGDARDKAEGIVDQVRAGVRNELLRHDVNCHGCVSDRRSDTGCADRAGRAVTGGRRRGNDEIRELKRLITRGRRSGGGRGGRRRGCGLGRKQRGKGEQRGQSCKRS